MHDGNVRVSRDRRWALGLERRPYPLIEVEGVHVIEVACAVVSTKEVHAVMVDDASRAVARAGHSPGRRNLAPLRRDKVELVKVCAHPRGQSQPRIDARKPLPSSARRARDAPLLYDPS